MLIQEKNNTSHPESKREHCKKIRWSSNRDKNANGSPKFGDGKELRRSKNHEKFGTETVNNSIRGKGQKYLNGDRN